MEKCAKSIYNCAPFKINLSADVNQCMYESASKYGILYIDK